LGVRGWGLGIGDRLIACRGGSAAQGAVVGAVEGVDADLKTVELFGSAVLDEGEQGVGLLEGRDVAVVVLGGGLQRS
jgi:hypothetical protein